MNGRKPIMGEDAWGIRFRYKPGSFERLALVAAERLGCSFVATEHMGADPTIGSPRLINPLNEDVDDVLAKTS